MILDLRGSDAITVSVAANRTCEVLYPSGSWRSAKTSQEAMRVFREEAQLVRLRCDARVLLEDITCNAIDLEENLLSYIASVETKDVPEAERKALDIIKGKLS